ncbi:hypothetical protein EKO27_g7782 [Xylaria grammica]|uniref:Uncharacterized protein n=1 Tax=Xylaria grammica TaxID=363999 RepID=A0A439CZ95_9PEZI|nr:hypothetical protein EKO27_g7782 [Xylaria grammica]
MSSAMAAPSGVVSEALLDITITSLSPEPELQRGRKRRRDFFDVGADRAAIPSGESATCRGRCRYRSSSRYLDVSSLSRPTSQHRMLVGNHQRNTSASPSPSRRKMIRITQLAKDHPRSLSPSRSRSPYSAYAGPGTALYTPKRRRQRTQSRSRIHPALPIGFGMTSPGDDVKVTAVEALVLPVTSYEVAVPNEVSMTAESSEQRRQCRRAS